MLSCRLLGRAGSLSDTFASTPFRLRRLLDDAPQVAALVIAVRQMTLAMLKERAATRPLLNNHQALLRYLSVGMARERHETARVLYLDSRGGLIEDEAIVVGAIDQVAIDLRQILAIGLDLGAAGLVLVHNHPSGCAAPSAEDIGLTRRLIQAAQVLGITVHDHLIVGRHRWVSLRREGAFEQGLWGS